MKKEGDRIFFIMYKDVTVVRISFSEGELFIEEIINENYLPLHIKYNIDKIDTLLPVWLNHRIIPKGRDGIEAFLNQLNIPSGFALSMKSLSASLSDPYWIKPVDSNKTWSEISFFLNDYDYDVGNILFDVEKKEKISYFSPDNTTNGQLKKVWRRIGGKDYLYKAGLYPDFQEPINEVFSSKVAEHFAGLDFVAYQLASVGNQLCSVCENFASEKEEFIPAFSIYQSFKKDITSTIYEHLVYCCEQFDIPDVREFIDRMMAFDYVIANTDRHMGNFGFMRDTDTLKFTRPAPLFDNGTSLWINNITKSQYKEKDAHIKITNNEKGFVSSIKNFDFLNVAAIKSLDEDLEELCKKANLEADKRNFISRSFKNRIQDFVYIRDRDIHKKFIPILTEDISR